MSNKNDNKIMIKVLAFRSFLSGILIPTLITILTGLLSALFLYLTYLIYALLSNNDINIQVLTIASFTVSALVCWFFGEEFYCTGHLFVTQYLKCTYMNFSNEETIRNQFSPSLKEIPNLLSFYDLMYKLNSAYRIVCILIDWNIILKLINSWS